MDEIDCVVVGTGLYGLAAAKHYRQFNPQDSLAIFERDSSIGGSWSDHRLYPGLKSNNLIGSYEYPDYPMNGENFGVKQHTHIPGTVVNRYLKAYAEEFGIAELIRFNTSVTVAEHVATERGGWQLTTVNLATGTEVKLYTRRLIVATGQTSEAFIPHFKGQETFGGNIFHGKDWLQNADTLQKCKTITIFGGSKLAWDAVYMYAKAGIKINWVIRYTRALTWFSPCVWGHHDGYVRIRNFLHGTAVGRTIVNGFWTVLGGDVEAANNYNAHPDTAKLKPWTHAMFTGPSFSILNYDSDIFELIKSDLVTVHIDEITHLSPGNVNLASGTALQSDALLAHTGWKHVPLIKFLPEGIETELGIPHPPHHTSKVDLATQAGLLQEADADILHQFPRLKDQPVWNPNYVPITEQEGINSNDETAPSKSLTPYMLYRFIVPASERFLETKDIAFSGVMSNFSNPINAHLHGLWISAYFNGQLSNDPSAAVGDKEALVKIQYETVLHNRFGKWRYPTDWGSSRPPSFIFDAVPYFDLLQQDLGLSPHRKGNWLAEMWSPYLPPDYRMINQEWEKLHKKIV
ncbi:hypothetical protein QQS21_001288 [Conoideocrella luteorostrata]|uniref:Uncharacterized protein n=1 Tax=Conoideocrella luteorostrata TaxID=1105319 RepID=A0AAJ0CXG6_9HYPO|nr:hypothetical protein QQS21_001288 [Conoideocrella luteorostrata]